MSELVVVVLLALHLLCVNVASAGPLVCLWLEWREGRGDVLAGRAGRYLAQVSLQLFVVAIVLGLAIGWILWSPEYAASIRKLGSRVHFGVAEIVFSLALMAGHFVWWRRAKDCSRRARIVRSLLPLAAGTNLLYHFPFLFVVLSRIVSGTDDVSVPLTGAEFRQRMMDGEVLARTVHFWLASLSVTGLALVGCALRMSRGDEPPAAVARVAQWGGRIALVPTLLQLPVGMWVLLQLDDVGQKRLMGGDAIGTALFALAVLAALLLMHQLTAVAMGNTKRGALIRSMALMFVVVLLMTGTVRR